MASQKAKLFVMIYAMVLVYNFPETVMNEAKKFVVQRHDRQNQPTHWDLMLEAGDFLETYRIGKPPEEWGMEPVEAVRIFDHPLKFLTYEGNVNKGKGSVKIADRGTYHVVSHNENRLILEVSGVILKGEFTFAVEGCPARRE